MYNILKNKTALYVEDEPEVLKNISTLLGNFFGEFHTAADGLEAWELFRSRSIDVALVDIELPKLNGLELIKRMRAINSEMPIIVISAYTKTDYLLESVELHLDKYIIKPLTSKKIHTLLDKLNEDFSNESIIELIPNVLLNTKTFTLIVDNKAYKLTAREAAFMQALGRRGLVTYGELTSIWGGGTPSDNAVRSFVRHLRKKIPEKLVENRSGIGYALAKN